MHRGEHVKMLHLQLTELENGLVDAQIYNTQVCVFCIVHLLSRLPAPPAAGATCSHALPLTHL